jgi:hypothetical protein
MSSARWIAAATGLAIAVATAASAAEGEWLSLCSKCVNPAITAKSGLGTSKATAEGRITRREIEAWCANWEPGNKTCVRTQLASEDTKKTWRASADCTAGRITAIDGASYTMAGTWTSDVGKGRSRWRDAAGKIVGQDNASNGLAISQQWETLCPAGTARPAAATGAAKPPQGPAAASPAQFAVGQAVEAKYGRDWVRGRVTRLRQTQGAGGAAFDYEVTLDNGQRGVLPARMLRVPSQ